MWHLREVSDDEITIDILADRECEFRFMMDKCIIFEDFSDPDDISFFIWYLDTDETETRDRCLDTDRFRLQCESEILLQGFDFREADSFTRTESILDDSRSDTLFFHIDIDAELEKGLLDKE